jgi:hypothetical protein
LRWLGRVRRTLTPVRDFDHAVAQRYEFRHNDLWLREHSESVWDLIQEAEAGPRDATGELNQLFLSQFFGGDLGRWTEFVDFIAGRTVLDIGGGPLPVMAFWPWAGRRIALDPLASEYSRSAANVTGRSWFDDFTVIDQPAEQFIPSLRGAVEGAIVCRNALDHTSEPYLILSNIASYASPGCRLLLWTDLHHVGARDAGHSDITKDRDGFARLIENIGFDIETETPAYDGRGTIEFGCVATKRQPGVPASTLGLPDISSPAPQDAGPLDS